MRISAVVALDEKRGIGKANMIPWHIREDLIRLKKLTLGHVTILGRTTYESMLFYYQKSGKPTMSQRTHIVVTRNPDFVVDKAHGFTASSVEEAIEKANEMNQEEIFVIGGAQIFQQAMPFLTRLYLTVVQNNFDCDTFFPDYSDFTKVVEKEEHPENDPSYTFLTLEKQNS